MKGKKIPLRRIVDTWDGLELVSYKVEDGFDLEKELGCKPRVRLPGVMFTEEVRPGRQNVSGSIEVLSDTAAVLTITNVWEG